MLKSKTQHLVIVFTFFLIISLVETSSLSSSTRSSAYGQPADGDYSTFSHPSDYYVLNYPSTWEMFYSPDGTIDPSQILLVPSDGVVSDNFERFFVDADKLSKGTLLNTYHEEKISGMLAVYPTFEVTNTTSTTLDGLPASLSYYTNGKDTGFVISTISGNIGVSIDYYGREPSFSMLLPDVMWIIDSFDISGVEGFRSYENYDYGIRILHPSDWSITENIQDSLATILFVSPETNSVNGGSAASFNIVILPGATGTDLEEAYEETIDNLKKSSEFQELISETTRTVGGQSAFQVEYIVEREGLDVHAMQDFWIIEDHFYVTTFVALTTTDYETYLPIAEQMLDSITLGEVIDRETEMLQYHNSATGISFVFPSNWIKTEEELNGGKSVYITSPDTSAVVAIVVADSTSTSDGVTEEMAQSFLNGLAKGQTTTQELTITESNPSAKLAGFTAHKFAYRMIDKSSNLELDGVAYLTMIKGRFYAFGYYGIGDSYSSYLPIADSIMTSLEIDTSNIAVIIPAHYIDSDLGIEIDLPENWTGVRTNYLNSTVLIAFPYNVGNASNNNNNNNMMTGSGEFALMMITSVKLADLFQGKVPSGSPNSEVVEVSSECKLPTSANIIQHTSANSNTQTSIKLIETDLHCSYEGIDARMKLYGLAVDSDFVMIAYMANSDALYERHIQDFEKSIATLSVEKADDMSNIAELMHQADGFEQSESLIRVGENDYSVNIATSSTISNLQLDSDKKQLTFNVEGETGTTGQTIIEVGHVLEGPYVIYLDGEVMNEGYTVVNDMTTNRTSIELTYPHSAHTIAIGGTRVVPEFPAIISLILVASLGLTIIAYRNLYRIKLSR